MIREEREGIGEERPRTVREFRYQSVKALRSRRRPGGAAEMGPETLLGGEAVKLGRSAGGGGEGRSVETSQDVSSENIGMDVCNRGGAAVAYGGGGDRRRGKCLKGHWGFKVPIAFAIFGF